MTMINNHDNFHDEQCPFHIHSSIFITKIQQKQQILLKKEKKTTIITHCHKPTNKTKQTTNRKEIHSTYITFHFIFFRIYCALDLFHPIPPDCDRVVILLKYPNDQMINILKTIYSMLCEI